jgi:hypothetical protein
VRRETDPATAARKLLEYNPYQGGQS